MSAPLKLRCAIYTRKSSEEGLDQTFNSLHAQREACAAFILSQASLGWKLVPDHYDDGGLSGGSMERPALQLLLQDIRNRKVDVVVVYKIDRLTRSLMDFARIVEIFDAQSVSFVSVTQQFNTTTSMGRLTLNVLLSFAQFEREVTAERIRDKIAASKKKGMWMGGVVPWGYRVENRKLIVDEEGAAEVRSIFDRYLEIGSVPALVDELSKERRSKAKEQQLDSRSIADTSDDGTTSSTALSEPEVSKSRRLVPINKGKLYHLLANPIYVGKIRHHAETYQGEHQVIIAHDVFEAAQRKLAEQAPRRKGLAGQPDLHLLNGLLFDENGDRLSPTHATKKGKRYRYYISSRLKGNARQDDSGWRLPAQEIEAVTRGQLRAVLSDQVLLACWMGECDQVLRTQNALACAASHLDRLDADPPLGLLQSAIHHVFHRIELTPHSIRFLVDPGTVVDWLTTASHNPSAAPAGEADCMTKRHRLAAGHHINSARADAIHIIELPLVMKRRGFESRMVIEGSGATIRIPDQPLVDLIARAHAYIEAFTDGTGRTRIQVAQTFGDHPAEVSRLLPLAFLSPKIVDAILTGRQPADLSARHLARKVELPIGWVDQAKLLGL
jgi:DNA invertase Pin-like site-specific DNA recombinase